MTDFPSLSEVLAEHYPLLDLHGHINGTVPGSVTVYDCWCGTVANTTIDAVLAHQADMWREACTITTVEQLDALPRNPLECEGVVVKDATGAICELDDDGTWTRDGQRSTPSCCFALPALLLWHPGWEKP